MRLFGGHKKGILKIIAKQIMSGSYLNQTDKADIYKVAELSMQLKRIAVDFVFFCHGERIQLKKMIAVI